MNNFTVPFTIESKSKDYVLSKLYEEKTESYLLKIPANKHLEGVINIRISPTSSDLDFTLKIEMGEGSSAVIIEDWSLEVKSPLIKYVNQIHCAPNSDLKYVILNHASSETVLEERRYSETEADAKCTIYAYHFGMKKVDSRLLQKTVGKQAEIYTDVSVKTTGSQEMNFDYEHEYASKNGSGEIGMKGIAQDKGMLTFDGMVNITRTGGGSAGYLQQETLNLSPDTIVKATPGLKIDTNDVKAGHGASVRNLNDEDLYYFGARGINKEEAKRLLITGFFGAELKKIQQWEGAYQTIKKLI